MDTIRNVDRYPGTDGHGYSAAYRYADVVAHADQFPNGNADADRYACSDNDADSNTYTFAHRYSDSDRNGDSYIDRDCHAIGYAQLQANQLADTGADGHAYTN